MYVIPLGFDGRCRHLLGWAADLDHGKAREVLAQLLDLGLIWLSEDDEVQAAIPLFFNYVKGRREQR